MAVFNLSTLILFLLLGGPGPKIVPTFTDFPAEIQKIAKPSLNLRSHPIGLRFRTVIRTAVREQGINFAGQYTIVKWGCSTNCSQFAIVDLRTGRIFHNPKRILARGVDFRPDSRLLIVDPWYEDAMFPHIPTSFYVWNGSTLDKVGSQEHAP